MYVNLFRILLPSDLPLVTSAFLLSTRIRRSLGCSGIKHEKIIDINVIIKIIDVDVNIIDIRFLRKIASNLKDSRVQLQYIYAECCYLLKFSFSVCFRFGLKEKPRFLFD